MAEENYLFFGYFLFLVASAKALQFFCYHQISCERREEELHE